MKSLLNSIFQAIIDESSTCSKLNPYEFNEKFSKSLLDYKDAYDTRSNGEMDLIENVYEYMENHFNISFNTAIQPLVRGDEV